MTAQVQPLHPPPDPIDDIEHYENIQAFLRLAASLCRSAEEEAYRGNPFRLEQYLRELKLTIEQICKEFRRIGTL